MGTFTTWVESYRAGNEQPLSKEELRTLVEQVAEQVLEWMNKRYRTGVQFGGAMPEDLAQEVVEWFLRTLNDGKEIPGSIKDTRTLVWHLVNKGCKRAYDRSQTRKAKDGKGQRERGGSGVSGLHAKGGITAKTFGQIADGQRRIGPTFDAADANIVCEESLVWASQDLVAWQGKGSRSLAILEDLINEHEKIEALAKKFSTSTTTIHKDKNRARFCVMRRLGFDQHSLEREFGEDATKWESELRCAGREILDGSSD